MTSATPVKLLVMFGTEFRRLEAAHPDIASRLTEAMQLKSDWRATAKVAGINWVCPACGEISEPQFDSCWKCGAAKA